jgi:HPt (histidine-containing phosphotransfer) domain-containing protein
MQLPNEVLYSMVIWKDAFEKIDTELDLTNRKKKALDDLLGSGRISQSTYDLLCKDLNEGINQIEIRRKALVEKMTNKLSELEEQLQTLEFFLANSEMAYTAGEINDELHAKESSALNLGLEATRQELNWIKEVVIQLVPKETISSTNMPSTVESVEATPTQTAIENAPDVTPKTSIEVPLEVTPVAEETKIETSSQVTVETTTEKPFRDEGENPPTQEEKKEEQT